MDESEHIEVPHTFLEIPESTSGKMPIRDTLTAEIFNIFLPKISVYDILRYMKALLQMNKNLTQYEHLVKAYISNLLWYNLLYMLQKYPG